MAEPPRLVGRATPHGLLIPAAELAARLGDRRAYNRFLGALTVRELPQPGRPKSYARARRTAYGTAPGPPGFLRVPRAAAPALLGRAGGRAVLDAVERGPGFAAARGIPAADWAPAQEFYPYQAAAADFVCRPGGPLDGAPPDGAPPATGAVYVQMGTGMGKSRFAMAVAARGRGPVFVVVPTHAIRLQWLDEFAAVFPRLRGAAYVNPPRGSRKVAATAATHDVVVGIVNTVRTKQPGFFAGYATVVIDEAHELASPANLAVLWLAQEAPRVLGLSATPDEAPSGLDRVGFHFLGRPLWAERDIPGFDVGDVCFRGRVREVEYAGHPDFCETAVSAAGTVSAVATIGNLVRDPARLRLVAAEVERLFRLHAADPPEPPATLAALGLGPRPAAAASAAFPEGGVRVHGVFVFAEHREYLPALRAALLERFGPGDVVVPELEGGGEDAGPGAAGGGPGAGVDADADAGAAVVLRGGASRAQVGRAHRARVVLTTFGYSRRGVSLVDMTAIVLATPRRNGMNQILGRVTRRGSDESIVRVVVDIKDVRSALKSQNTSRREVYKAKEYPIFRVRVSHEDFAFGAAAPPTAAEEPVWAPGGELAWGEDDGAAGGAAGPALVWDDPAPGAGP